MEDKKLYKANPDFVIRKIAGEILAVPTGMTAHELNAAVILTESGAILWDCLSQHPQTKNDLADTLLDTYDIDPETAKKYI